MDTNLNSENDVIISYLQQIIDNMNSIIGDSPVSEQLGSALSHMASKEHKHKEYALNADVEDLKLQVEKLNNLIGDTSVAEQINNAILK